MFIVFLCFYAYDFFALLSISTQLFKAYIAAFVATIEIDEWSI